MVWKIKRCILLWGLPEVVQPEMRAGGDASLTYKTARWRTPRPVPLTHLPAVSRTRTWHTFSTRHNRKARTWAGLKAGVGTFAAAELAMASRGRPVSLAPVLRLRCIRARAEAAAQRSPSSSSPLVPGPESQRSNRTINAAHSLPRNYSATVIVHLSAVGETRRRERPLSKNFSGLTVRE